MLLTKSINRICKGRNYVSIPDLFSYNSQQLCAENVEDPPKATFVNGKYVCRWSKECEKSLTDSSRWIIEKALKGISPYRDGDDRELLQEIKTCKSFSEQVQTVHATWIGHATFYIETPNLNFLTDPVWSDRVSFSKFIGPKRLQKIPVALSELKPDVVLLSHTHYDHLDLATASEIGNKCLWIVPLGVKSLLNKISITNIVELDWWQTHTIKAKDSERIHDIGVSFLPAKHWTGRTLYDRNTCLWGSFAVKSYPYNIFFAGDTAYCPRLFKMIGSKCGPFDMSLLPIGCYRPSWFMKSIHCDPNEALQMHLDLRSAQSIGMHWGTFELADERSIEPPLELARWRKFMNVEPYNMFTMKHGETWRLGDSPRNDFACTNPNLLEDYSQLLLRDPSLRLGC